MPKAVHFFFGGGEECGGRAELSGPVGEEKEEKGLGYKNHQKAGSKKDTRRRRQ